VAVPGFRRAPSAASLASLSPVAAVLQAIPRPYIACPVSYKNRNFLTNKVSSVNIIYRLLENILNSESLALRIDFSHCNLTTNKN